MVLDDVLEKCPFWLLKCMFSIYHNIYLRSRFDRLFQYFKNSNDIEDKRIACDMSKRKILDVFYGDWLFKYDKKRFRVYSDNRSCYVWHKCIDGKQRKMYFKPAMKKGFCEFYYRGIIKEQDINSPHVYLTEKIIEHMKKNPNGIVLDMGAAEGVLAVDLSGLYRKCYLFEPDKRWVSALKKTFKGRSEEISIVSRFVSDEVGVNTITIDALFGDKIPSDITLIKMDIEGFESAALRGMKNTMEANPNAIILACAYHNKDDEKKIRNIVEPMGYEVVPHNDYMFLWSASDFEPPYKRHGVLEIRKKS